MRYVNSIVFAGLIACGVLLFAGHALHSGTTEALAAYIGWFLAVYSAFAYTGSGTLFLLQKMEEFWKTLYPVNFGLTLIALSLFGLQSQELVPMLLAVALLGIFAGTIVYHLGILRIRAVPLALLTSLCVCFVASIATRWIFVFVFVAAVLLACSSLTRLRRGVR